MNTPLRGVNLGGWLVLERWMTPTLFRGSGAHDEWTFMHAEGARELLRHHRDTFITEADFAWIAEHGLNAVRLPVGYWIIDPDGPYAEGIAYVDWAYQMAEKYQLQVLLDLHGAPRSQNGHDHSGQQGKAGWFDDLAAQQRTIAVIEKLHARYKHSPSHWGIELLNEPQTRLFQRTLRRFYRQAAATIDGHARIVFHDGFTPRLLNGALGRHKRAVIDVHLYHMTSWLAKGLSAQQFVRHSHWWYSRLLQNLSQTQPVIVGEWSIVIKKSKLRGISDQAAAQLMQAFGKAQIKAYEQHALGWFYWSYKTEQPSEWNYRWLVEEGMLP